MKQSSFTLWLYYQAAVSYSGGAHSLCSRFVLTYFANERSLFTKWFLYIQLLDVLFVPGYQYITLQASVRTPMTKRARKGSGPQCTPFKNQIFRPIPLISMGIQIQIDNLFFSSPFDLGQTLAIASVIPYVLSLPPEMRKLLVQQNTMLTPFLPNFLPWDFRVS